MLSEYLVIINNKLYYFIPQSQYSFPQSVSWEELDSLPKRASETWIVPYHTLYLPRAIKYQYEVSSSEASKLESSMGQNRL